LSFSKDDEHGNIIIDQKNEPEMNMQGDFLSRGINSTYKKEKK
jgi:hypothetical protein